MLTVLMHVKMTKRKAIDGTERIKKPNGKIVGNSSGIGTKDY